MASVRVSAPGKVILHGEHSVVYGRRAVALAVDLRTTLTLTLGGMNLVLHLPEVDLHRSWPLESVKALWERLGRPGEAGAAPLSEAQVDQLRQFLEEGEDGQGGYAGSQLVSLEAFFQLYLAILPHPLAATVNVESQLPTGAGLGSSASYSVCLSAALLKVAGRGVATEGAQAQGGLSLEEVSRWAFRSEVVVHGTPSGIDNSICTYGGTVSFKAGSCAPLAAPHLEVLLVNTRVPRSTKALVTAVRARRQRLPRVVESVLDALDAAAECSLDTLSRLASDCSTQQRDEAYAALHELVDVNHALLSALGVSHPSLERLVGVAAAHGLHAKLTGAGGGGFGVVVLPRSPDKDAVQGCVQQLQDAGFQVWQTSLGAPGLTLHQQQQPVVDHGQDSIMEPLPTV